MKRTFKTRKSEPKAIERKALILQNRIIFVYNLELTVTAQARKYDELGKHQQLN